MTTIGLWGGFDLESLGAQLALRVVRAELERRLPTAAVRAFAPYGATRPIPFDGGEPVEPLDPPSPEHIRALADALDLVVVVGDLADLDPVALASAYGVPEATASALAHLLVTGLPEVPLAWSSVSVPAHLAEDAPRCARVSVVDTPSIGVLPGVDRVPEPAVLATRVFPRRVVDKRLSFLRAMGWWPAQGSPTVVQGGAVDADRAGEVAEALGRASVVVVEADSGDSAFADALTALLPAALRVPALAGVEDRVAAVASSRAVVAASPTLRALAVAYGRPVAGLDTAASPEAPQPAGAPAEILDAEYDSLAALVAGADVTPLVAAEVAAVRAALDARGRRLAIERSAMADYVASIQSDYEGRLARCADEAGAVARENALLRSRWSIRLRSAAGRAARRMVRRP
ncbi:MAG: hypothetical protein M5U31_15925 [Acidimicrobiia bacterium]|nr:hypothetical protein [Acidimicrobiia bacterium]